MFCSNCGKNIGEVESKLCSDCYSKNVNEFEKSKILTNKYSLTKLVFYCVLALFVLLTFFNVSADIKIYGLNVSNISSVGGKTLEEAYYYEIGNIFMALSSAISAFGVFLSAILVYIGIKK